jgi:hypothetical protein
MNVKSNQPYNPSHNVKLARRGWSRPGRGTEGEVFDAEPK